MNGIVYGELKMINKSVIIGDSSSKNLSIVQDGCLGDTFFIQKLQFKKN